MKRIIALTAAAAILSLSVQAFAFDDITAASALNESVTQLNALGVINGYEDGTFRPDNQITRAEMAKIALSLLPETVNPGVDTIDLSGSSLYTDVDTTHWADSVIGRMSTLNFLNGYEDGTFRPNDPVTYQDVIKIIVEMLNYGDDAAHSGGYPHGYIAAADKLGITKNVEFSPTNNASRGDAAVIVYNALDIPCRVITSYTVGGGAEYETDENITFRRMITGAM